MWRPSQLLRRHLVCLVWHDSRPGTEAFRSPLGRLDRPDRVPVRVVSGGGNAACHSAAGVRTASRAWWACEGLCRRVMPDAVRHFVDDCAGWADPPRDLPPHQRGAHLRPPLEGEGPAPGVHVHHHRTRTKESPSASGWRLTFCRARRRPSPLTPSPTPRSHRGLEQHGRCRPRRDSDTPARRRRSVKYHTPPTCHRTGFTGVMWAQTVRIMQRAPRAERRKCHRAHRHASCRRLVGEGGMRWSAARRPSEWRPPNPEHITTPGR